MDSSGQGSAGYVGNYIVLPFRGMPESSIFSFLLDTGTGLLDASTKEW